MQDKSCLRVCSRGLYSCYWRKPSEIQRKCSCFWLSVVAVVSILASCWMFIWFFIYNDRDDFNSELFRLLKWWVNWFMVLIITSAVLSIYCVLLLMFALIQVALGEKLDLHWLHKIFLFLGVMFITGMVIVISWLWQEEWPTIPLALQAVGPFLQIGAVGALTLLSAFVFKVFFTAKSGSKCLIALAFLIVSAAIFLCPLAIQSPCLIELDNLPERPKLIGHRGAPMLAPENTMMSFERSLTCNVTTFETDVQLSRDHIPFLMHDNKSEFLLRTTNVGKIFPNQSVKQSTDLTFKEYQRLNAGEWFLQRDPFHSVSQLSEEKKEEARNQTIPSLGELLQLAKKHKISVMFDLYSPDQGNITRLTVKTILDSGIDPKLILWVPPAQREYVMTTAPDFIQVYKNVNKMKEENGSHLNVQYNKLRVEEIRDLRRKNVSVNLWTVNERWLFSLLWCSGASSVTTNACHLLNTMDKPLWTISHANYRIIWITTDALSCMLMILLFIWQSKKVQPHHFTDMEADIRSAKNWRELSPLYPNN